MQEYRLNCKTKLLRWKGIQRNPKLCKDETQISWRHYNIIQWNSKGTEGLYTALFYEYNI